jgi:plastocyanin
MYRRTFIIVTTVLAPGLVACGGAVEEAPAQLSAAVDMHDIYYGMENDHVQNLPEWAVSSGVEFAVNMENVGALEHSWVILKQGEEIPTNYDEATETGKVLFSTGNVTAGANEAVRFNAPAQGEYNVLCTAPGHGAIMQGRSVVTG